MKLLYFAPAPDARIDELRVLGHAVDVVSTGDGFAGAIPWRDAARIEALASAADGVILMAGDGSPWAAELLGTVIADDSAEQIVQRVSGGDPDIGRRAIAQAYGPLLSQWGIPASGEIVERIDTALALFSPER